MILTFNINPLSGGFSARFVECDYTQLKFVLNNDDGKGKFEVSGTIKLFGSDYDFYNDSVLVAANGYEIICYGDGGTFFTANYKFIQITEENKSLKQISLSLKAETEYTDENWFNIDTEYNINTITPETLDLYWEQGNFPMANKPDNATTYENVYAIPNDMSAVEIANWDINYCIDAGSCLAGTYTVLAVYYRRQIGYGYYLGTDKYNPDGVAYTATDWTYLSDITAEGRIIPMYKKVIVDNYIGDLSQTGCNNDITNTISYQDNYSIEYASVTRPVPDVIEWLIGEMGLSISFDSSGTSTDSFYSFKSMTGESLTVGDGIGAAGTTTDLLFKRLLIMNLTDFIPADDDGQNDVLASVTMVSLQTILNPFLKRGFFWYLQNRAGTFYFILEHKSIKTLGSSNPDLSNYKGRNWLPYANFLEKEPPEYHKVINLNENNSIDFIGTELVMRNTFSTDTVKDWQENNIFVDLDDIATRRDETYSATEENNIVIIAAQTDTGVKDYVRQATGELSLISKNNSELSWSYTSEKYLCDLPENKIQVNGSDFTASAYRLKKRNKYKITVPGDNIISDFDVSDYLLWFTDQAEIDSISQSAGSNLFDIIFNL